MDLLWLERSEAGNEDGAVGEDIGASEEEGNLYDDKRLILCSRVRIIGSVLE